MKTIKIIKSILRKTMILTGSCILSIFVASANFSNPDAGWKSSPADVSTISSTGEKTIFDQTERTPFGEDEVPQSQLRASPGGMGQKNEVPVDEGIWVVVGLAVVYGVVRRKSKKDTL